MRFGIDKVFDFKEDAKAWGRCGLLSNQASLNANLIPSWQVLKEILGSRLTTLFSPQHGFCGTVQDNMIESAHTIHRSSQLRVFSLYSEVREPTSQMLKDVDTIILDVQIVGCRVYTFKYTMAACLRAAVKHHKKVVVLDRPNPIGGVLVEGRVLDEDATSFVGEFPIPMRHGLTAAELCLLFNLEIGADLEVVPLEGWQPEKSYNQTLRPWIPTSPNLPTIESVLIYPGTVLFEGTNCSEGRGTSLPFQLIGAPYIESSEDFVDRISQILGKDLPKGLLRPATFMPTSQKWAGRECNGCQIVIRREDEYHPFSIGLATLRAAIYEGKEHFEWKSPPYEYDYSTLPIKLILGSQKADKELFADRFSPKGGYWQEGLESYIDRVKSILLYERSQKAS